MKGIRENSNKKNRKRSRRAVSPILRLLYDAVNPKVEADKALVAGYWVQVISR